MRLKVLMSSLLLLLFSAHQWAGPIRDNGQTFSPRIRTFRFIYAFTVKDIPTSTGRDVTLSLKRKDRALNYFVYPYVEIDGKPYEKLEKKFSFAEVEPLA